MERKWWTLLAVCVATFMLLIDVTIVNVALPDIQRDLDASLSSLQWVIDAYALTLASFLLVAGSHRRPDRPPAGVQLRLRRSSPSPRSLCGLSGDPTVLNFARGVQGMRRRRDVRDRAGADRAGVRGQRARERDRRSGARRSAARSRSGR